MVLATLDPDPVAVPPDGSTRNSYGIDSAAADADPGKAARDRVSAFQYHTGKIDSRSRCCGDDDTALGRVRDSVASRANPDLALHLRAGTRGANAGSIGESGRGQDQHQRQESEAHGRTG